jgi:phosphate acetyltransferase
MTNTKIFIASTGKDVGKTTLSLGLIDYLRSKYGSCGFMKPIGQDQLIDHGISLDKDAILIKNFFNLKETKALSPVAIPKGFTKDFLDEKITKKELTEKILKAQTELAYYSSLIIEGTGHLGVGSIIDLNNAEVAKLLNAPIILVTKGGLGSSFDELMLNLALCEKYGLKVLGVVLNKVKPDKFQMLTHYFEKALNKIGIPFLGALPYDLLLAQASFNDVASVLDSPIYHGHDLSLKHISNMTIIASNNQVPEVKPYELVIVSSSREGLIHSLIYHASEHKIPLGFILTGDNPPSDWILKELEKTPHLILKTPKKSQDVLLELSLFHAKIQAKDITKIEEAISIVKKHIHFEKIIL